MMIENSKGFGRACGAAGRVVALLMVLLAAAVPALAVAQTSLRDLAVSAGSAGFEVTLEFDGTPPEPEQFMLEDPARLTLDFPGVRSALSERRHAIPFAGADSVTVIEARDRTRVVLNLDGVAPYTTRIQGNMLVLTVTPVAAAAAAPLAQAVADSNAGFTPVPRTGNAILGIDFKSGDNGMGQIIVALGNPDLSANISQRNGELRIRFEGATVAPENQARFDVSDFATPVRSVSLYEEDGGVVVLADVSDDFEYFAYQSQGQYLVNVLTPAEAAVAAAANQYSGEPISMNFQNIEIRTALQLLADFSDFSLVVGDNVTGTMALRLDNVPWDLALDMVLRPRGLGKRVVGNVLYVAPAGEIAESELREIEVAQRVEALAPLVTEYIQINYARAQDVLILLRGGSTADNLLGGGAGGGAGAGGVGGGLGGAGGAGGVGTQGSVLRGLLSERGRASSDARTNTIIVQDVQPVIDDIRRLVERIDVPVRQVLIEARIVNASTNFSKALGVRWGGTHVLPDTGDRFILGGSLANTVEMAGNITDYNQAIAAALAGGASLQEALALNTLVGPSFPEALLVDLGVEAAGASSIAIGYQGDNGLLQLELSALEASGNGEVIAQPKVTTQDKQQARIESGLQIPYQAQAGGTAGGSTTEFVTAALSLDVTPQITPDGRIVMLLDIHQDSVVTGTGAVPAIATNSVNTRVLVNNGETIVLGGVFREEVTTSVTKTPLLGDLPYVGNLFKRTENTENKTELLIFITPSIINELR